MKDKRVLIRAAAGVLIVAAAVLYLVIRPAVVRSRIEKDFTPSDLEAKTQYRTCSSMEEMDLSKFSSWLGLAVALPGGEEILEMTLPCDVTYYTMENGRRKEALKLSQGTIVEIHRYENNLGRDFQGYPTFEKGWRYVRPFRAIGSEADEQYYYVRTNVLERAVRSYLRTQNETAGNRRMNLIESRDAVYRAVRYIDVVFYHEGIYCSPDLTSYPVVQ